MGATQFLVYLNRFNSVTLTGLSTNDIDIDQMITDGNMVIYDL